MRGLQFAQAEVPLTIRVSVQSENSTERPVDRDVMGPHCKAGTRGGLLHQQPPLTRPFRPHPGVLQAPPSKGLSITITLPCWIPVKILGR